MLVLIYDNLFDSSSVDVQITVAIYTVSYARPLIIRLENNHGLR